jgi:hypothetical protein
MHTRVTTRCLKSSGAFVGKRWLDSKKGFFIPVKVPSIKFRGKFLYYFKREYYGKKFKLSGDTEVLKEKMNSAYL